MLLWPITFQSQKEFAFFVGGFPSSGAWRLFMAPCSGMTPRDVHICYGNLNWYQWDGIFSKYLSQSQLNTGFGKAEHIQRTAEQFPGVARMSMVTERGYHGNGNDQGQCPGPVIPFTAPEIFLWRPWHLRGCSFARKRDLPQKYLTGNPSFSLPGSFGQVSI